MSVTRPSRWPHSKNTASTGNFLWVWPAAQKGEKRGRKRGKKRGISLKFPAPRAWTARGASGPFSAIFLPPAGPCRTFAGRPSTHLRGDSAYARQVRGRSFILGTRALVVIRHHRAARTRRQNRAKAGAAAAPGGAGPAGVRSSSGGRRSATGGGRGSPTRQRILTSRRPPVVKSTARSHSAAARRRRVRPTDHRRRASL